MRRRAGHRLVHHPIALRSPPDSGPLRAGRRHRRQRPRSERAPRKRITHASDLDDSCADLVDGAARRPDDAGAREKAVDHESSSDAGPPRPPAQALAQASPSSTSGSYPAVTTIAGAEPSRRRGQNHGEPGICSSWRVQVVLAEPVDHRLRQQIAVGDGDRSSVRCGADRPSDRSGTAGPWSQPSSRVAGQTKTARNPPKLSPPTARLDHRARHARRRALRRPCTASSIAG